MLLADFDATDRLDSWWRGYATVSSTGAGKKGGQFAALDGRCRARRLFGVLRRPPVSRRPWPRIGTATNVLDLRLHRRASVVRARRLHFRLGRGDGTFDAEVPCALAMGVIGDIDNEVARRPDQPGSPSGPRHLQSQEGRHGLRLARGARGAFADSTATATRMSSSTARSASAWATAREPSARPSRFPGVGTATPPRGAFLFGDVNRDAKLDVVYTRPDGWSVFLNTCP